MAEKKIRKIYQILSKEYLTFAKNNNEWESNGLNSTDFKSLVSTMLSATTHSKRVIKACKALFAQATTPQEILELTDKKLAELIKPVAYYNNKTKYLKEMSRQIIERHNGKVPQTKKELMDLQGVGRKTAEILINFNFGGNTIAVDTHIHRLLNRLGVVDTKKNTATSDIINEITPENYKKHAHEWLIQHGGKVCIARKPKCEECVITKYCDYYQSKS